MHERVARGEPRQWLLKQFTERPGEVIYLDDLHANSSYSPASIQRAMVRLINTGTVNIEIVMRGRAWVYKPNATKPEPEVEKPKRERPLKALTRKEPDREVILSDVIVNPRDRFIVSHQAIITADMATAQGLRLTHQILGEDFYERIAKLLKELAKQSRS